MSQVGFYSVGSSYLHSRHPAVKLILFAVLITLLPFVLIHWQAYLLLLAGLSILLSSARVQRKHLLYFLPALSLIVLTSLSWFFTDLGGRIILEVHLGSYTYVLREQTWNQILTSSLRALVWVLSYIVLLTTTSSRDLVVGLEQLRLPRPMCQAVGMTLRFWHTAIADTKQVMDSQRVRGVDYEHGSGFKRFKQRFLVATIPTMFLLLKRFRTLSFALALRSFGAPGKKTRLYAPQLSRNDVLFFCGTLALLIAILVFDRWGMPL